MVFKDYYKYNTNLIMCITIREKECKREEKRGNFNFWFLISGLFIFSFFFTSCKWGTSKEGEPRDSVIIFTGDSILTQKLPFVNQYTYFYEDTVEIAGKIGLLKGSFVLDTAYALCLDEAIEALPKKEEVRDMEDPDIPQPDIRQIHLLWTDPEIDIKCFVDKQTVLKGTLWGRYSGSHYTPVVMNVISMRPDE